MPAKTAAHINAWRRLKQVADRFVGVDLTHTGKRTRNFWTKGAVAPIGSNTAMPRRAGLPVLLPVDLLLRFVMLHETSARIHLETRLLAAGFDNNLVIPLPIRVVFPDYPNDVSACCLLINCLLDCCGEGFQVNLFSGMFSGLSGCAESEPNA